MSEHNFSFTVDLPNSIFTFIHHVKSIIEEVNFYDEAFPAAKDLAMKSLMALLHLRSICV